VTRTAAPRQLDLIADALTPPSNGTPTSNEAARRIRPHAAALREQIRAYIEGRGMGGATADEIETMLRIPGNTVRPRLVELVALGRLGLPGVCKLGQQRATRSGRMAEVYIACGKADA
jgi:hypothetical protein